MKKIRKSLSMCLVAILSLSFMCIDVTADESTENIHFVETDENGNIVEIINMVYLENVAEAYEQNKLLRWTKTSYYDLADGPLTINGNSADIVESTKHFNANSSGRLYYYGEVTDGNAYIDLYDITNGKYKGSFALKSQGGGIYSRSGYITGLSSSSSQYYSFGLSAKESAFSSYYAAISWNSI